MRPLAFVALLLLSFCANLVPRADADSLFHFTSDPGDYIGLGEEHTLTTAAGYTFQVSNYGSNGLAFEANGATFYSVLLTAPTGAPLAVGNYPQAVRMATATNPEIDFSGDGRGSESTTGQFQILELTYDANGNVATLAANFVQHGDNNAAAAYGQIRFNSSVPYSSPAGVAQLSINLYRVLAPAGSLTVTATRHGGGTGPLSVAYATADGTDRAGRDYTTTAGTVSWTDGDTADKTFTIPILNSGNPFQGDGTFFVNLNGAGTGAQTQATVTVLNDDSAVTYVHLTSDPGEYVGQGKDSTFNILDGYRITAVPNSQGGVSLTWDNYAAVGAADSQFWNADFAGATDAILAVGDYQNATRYPFQDGTPGLDVSGDSRGYNSETGNFQVLEVAFDDDGNVLHFAANFVQYGDGSTAALHGQVRYRSTLGLPAASGTVQFTAAAYRVAENAGTATITVERDGGTSGALSVQYATTDGTAVGGVNYTPTAGTLTWADGDAAPKTFTVAVQDDGVYSADLSLSLGLSGPAVGTLARSTLTVLNEDSGQPGVAQFSGATYAAQETDGTATITVNRSGGSTGALSVNYATFDGTAQAGRDYAPVNGTLSWVSGDSSPKFFTVPIIDAHVTGGGTRALAMHLSGANLGALGQATLNIADNDISQLPLVSVIASTPTVQEKNGLPGAFTLGRTGDLSRPLTVAYKMGGSAINGQDYQLLKGTKTIKAGKASVKVLVQPLGAGLPAGDRLVVKLKLVPEDGVYTVSALGTAKITLLP